MAPIAQTIAARNGPFHTYEFFPPRTEAGLVNLLDRIRRLAAAPLPAPLAVSVTWGAGGATADRSLELAEHVVKMGLEVILHLTCTNMPKAKVDEALQKCKQLGISNILALRGDPPRTEEYGLQPETLPDFFQHADDLVKYIRSQPEYHKHFCVGVAGYPTPHPDSATPESEMKWLKVKCDAGAEFIITQLFYDMDGFEQWVKECRAAGITIPIIPGVMPIQNFASFRRLVKLTGCPVPESIMRELEPISSDDAAVKRYGADLATKMVSRLVASGLVQGVHFCTLNLEKSVRTILENVGWTQQPAISTANGGGSPPVRHNQLIGEEGQSLSISPSEASHLAEWGLHHAQPPVPKRAAVAGGQSAEDSWDEYPNGRFTDVRSPAYGEIDGWGSGLKQTPALALKEWGTPTGPEDLARLFVSYLDSDPSTPTTPFCDLPLSPESATILSQLKALNSADKRYWTVGSQPAVDAASSEDPVVGWGPARGYVFQKAFVEFFVPSSEVVKIEDKLLAMSRGGANERISMYASNKQGEFRTNTTKDAVNAVTWGVFPGQEIVQSTIIEETSFLAWKEEAFDIWTEWSRLYPKRSPARTMLEGIAEDWWLVSLIHHDYKDPDGLWDFLLQ